MARCLPSPVVGFCIAALAALATVGCAPASDEDRANELAAWLAQVGVEAVESADLPADEKPTPSDVHDLALDVASKIEDAGLAGSPEQAKSFVALAERALAEEDTAASLTRLEQAISKYVGALTVEYGVERPAGAFEYDVF